MNSSESLEKLLDDYNSYYNFPSNPVVRTQQFEEEVDRCTSWRAIKKAQELVQTPGIESARQAIEFLNKDGEDRRCDAEKHLFLKSLKVSY